MCVFLKTFILIHGWRDYIDLFTKQQIHWKTTIIKTLFYNLQITNAIGGGLGEGERGGK